MSDKIQFDVEVLDKDICIKCRLFEMTSYTSELVAGGDVVGVLTKNRCRNVNKCRYLRNLFGSASETPSKIED